MLSLVHFGCVSSFDRMIETFQNIAQFANRRLPYVNTSIERIAKVALNEFMANFPTNIIKMQPNIVIATELTNNRNWYQDASRTQLEC